MKHRYPECYKLWGVLLLPSELEEEGGGGEGWIVVVQSSNY
jgi:hypothetical protein